MAKRLPKHSKACHPQPLSGMDLAEWLDVGRSTVTDWVRKGCPRQKDGTFVLAEVVKWREALAAGTRTEDDWQTEKDKQLALTHAFKLQVLKGEYIRGDRLDSYLAERFAAFRNTLQGIGQAIAPQAVGLSAQSIRDLIDARLRRACDDLCREGLESLREEVAVDDSSPDS